MICKKMRVQSWVILRMNKGSFIEAIDASNLSDQTKFRLNEINEVKSYFNSEIWERKVIDKSLVHTLLLLIILTKL